MLGQQGIGHQQQLPPAKTIIGGEGDAADRSPDRAGALRPVNRSGDGGGGGGIAPAPIDGNENAGEVAPVEAHRSRIVRRRSSGGGD